MYGFSDAINLLNPLFHVENDQQAGVQMSTDEIDSWLLPNLYNNPIEDLLNLTTCFSWSENQDHGKFNHMQTQDIQVNYHENHAQSSTEALIEQQHEHILNFSQGVQNDYSTSAIRQFEHVKSFPICHGHITWHDEGSFPPTGLGILPDATIDTMNLGQECALNEFSFSPLHHEILVDVKDGRQSDSIRTSSLGTQQQALRDDSKRSSEIPPMSRKERIIRYLEKKKLRKYKKKIIYSSRKAFARTRPRIKGRFVRRSETNVK
ncbi:hypothetical protein M8C21_006319 [Ambrosia artemisiifolia]|uniref:CCT domain-containing protein n=1 Tax=Ambrosia artemisiifolia TaxID=4212 RepID=A0AAD5GLC9_AMBAR|nr:hypothetical protein M8C21_006319 [Ambrosia artemisiifolia]